MEDGFKKAKIDSTDEGGAMDMEATTSQTMTTCIRRKASDMSNRDIVLSLRPIVLGLQDNNDYKTLCDSLGKMDFLQVESISRDENEIMKEVFDIYRQTRALEAASVPTDADEVPLKYKVAAIEIRNAILFSELEEIGEGMKVYRGFVPNMQVEGQVTKVVIRPQDEAFWDRCIDLCMEDYPVCGVGNPGIGKTTTSLYALQQLVRERRTPVVYTIRKTWGSKDVFYEFTPVVDPESTQLNDVAVKIYQIAASEKHIKIPALKNTNAVYFVDPGDYEYSCDDARDCEARFIMDASNDEKHWGGNNFTKFRGSASPLEMLDRPTRTHPGILVFGSPWTGRQVVLAKPYLHLLQQLTDNEVLRRYRIVGGSLRDVLFFDERNFTNKVQTALELDAITIHELVEGRYKFTFQPNAPSSILVGICPSDNAVTVLKITLKSDHVEERLAIKHLRASWYAVLDEENSGNRGNIFESYLRVKFSKEPMRFSTAEARESVRERPGKKNEKKNYRHVAITVGSSRSVLRVSNMVETVRTDQTQLNLYYSKNESEELIDMIYRVDGGFEAIQSTVRKSHDASPDKIRSLKTKLGLGENETLKIFYAVPSPRFAQFVTDPVNPLLDQPDLGNVSIFHLCISAAADD